MAKWGGGLEKLWNHYDEVLTRLPDARKTALEAAGKALKAEVDRQIDKQLPNHDAGGRVKSWQEVTMGTKGGYVKVAPQDETVSESKKRWSRSTEKYSSKQITRWLEHGHKMVLPKKACKGFYNNDRGDDYRYVQDDRNGNLIVRGFLFYSWAKMDAQKLAEGAAQEVLELLANDLEDFAAGQISMEGWL